jgi:hypothetical protein
MLDVNLWAGFSWLAVVPNDASCEHGYKLPYSIEVVIISWTT